MTDTSRECKRRPPFIDCDEIEYGLYLGNMESAHDLDTLKTHRITHVLTAFVYPLSFPDNVVNLFIDLSDMEEENILSHFDESNAFIKKALKEGACLVHCYAGMSRSATFVIAYIMQKYSISFETALKRVKAKRHLVNPNDGYRNQLKLYESMKCTLDESNQNYRIFLLKDLRARLLQDTCDDFNSVRNIVNSRYFQHSGGKFKCKYCRHWLFSESHLISHAVGVDLDWKITEEMPTTYLPCKSSFFIEILPWIETAFKERSGKILCPKCQAKLGSFNWDYSNCSCGAYMCPSFRISPNKVDEEKEVP